MYEQRQKPKKKIKDNNRQDTRSGVTNKSSNRPKIGDDFFARPSNGLLQRQPQGQVKSIVPDYFRARYGTIQRMAVMLSAAEMLALVARLVAGLVGGVALTKSLEELNQSPEFERMTDTQKMMVYAVLYKVANKQNFNKQEPNKTETLPTEHKARLTTGGSEITEQGTTTTSRPMTDQAILDLLGPIPAPDDMALDSRTGLPIVDDLGLGLVYGEERDDSATATGQRGGTNRVVTQFEQKIEKQMGKRGWDKESVNSTIENPNKTVSTRDTRWKSDGTRHDAPATAYIRADGHYVVRNDNNGTIVQISNRNATDWKSPFE